MHCSNNLPIHFQGNFRKVNLINLKKKTIKLNNLFFDFLGTIFSNTSNDSSFLTQSSSNDILNNAMFICESSSSSNSSIVSLISSVEIDQTFTPPSFNSMIENSSIWLDATETINTTSILLNQAFINEDDF